MLVWREVSVYEVLHVMFSHMSAKSVVENDAYAFGSVRHHVPCKWTDMGRVQYGEIAVSSRKFKTL